MSSVWQCGRCFALHFGGERVCRRCGAPRPAPSVPTVVAREPASEAVHLHMPPTDFPYSRRARTRERQNVAPIVLLLLAALVAFGWDPVVRKVAAARALGGESPAALEARRHELALATHQLSKLLAERAGPNAPPPPPTWREEVLEVGRTWRLSGDSRSLALGDLEVRVRALWLAVSSLPDDPAAVGPHVTLAREELSRVSEDLTHAR